jgi:hypothetical protein
MDFQTKLLGIKMNYKSKKGQPLTAVLQKLGRSAKLSIWNSNELCANLKLSASKTQPSQSRQPLSVTLLNDRANIKQTDK